MSDIQAHDVSSVAAAGRARGRAARRVGEVLVVALRLGLTSFGGPIAHLGYFRQEYVLRRRWIDEESYADLVALCQMLPGPASSQVGMAIGITRAGLAGGLAAWLGFTLPSAVAMIVVALVLGGGAIGHSAAIQGLLLVAVAVVAQAVWGMARTLAPDRQRGTLAIVAAVVALLWPVAVAQIVIIVVAGVLGRVLLPSPRLATATASAPLPRRPAAMGRRLSMVLLALFAGLLVLLPVLRRTVGSPWLAMCDSFYRAGALVFGGGHLILPLLQREVVPPGWLTNAQFLAGYGAAQAVPGPLSTFAAYLGAARHMAPNGIMGAVLALVAIYLPSFLLVAGVLPFWEALRRRQGIQSALRGVNAAVVGLLLAALYQPVWTSAVHSARDLALVLVAGGLLMVWRLPPWIVVGLTVAGSIIFAAVGGQAA